MTKIIEIKDKVLKFCAEYESYLQYLYKFLTAFALFLVINSSIGFMEKISTSANNKAIGIVLIFSINPMLLLITINNANAARNLYKYCRYDAYSAQNLNTLSFISIIFVIMPPTFSAFLRAHTSCARLLSL